MRLRRPAPRARGTTPDLVAALLTQQRLQARAVAKFGEFANDMLYTADRLEQASRLEVAATHAGRFDNASLATVHDLGCGIGSDAVAMSALGVTVQGVDIDPVTAAIADINLRPWPDSRARLAWPRSSRRPATRCARGWGCGSTRPAGCPAATGRHGRIKRVFRLDEIRPTWEFVLQVATAVPATGAKLSPSMPHDAIPLGTEAQWTSFAGEVLECAVWWGPLAQRPGRSARILGPSRSPIEVGETMAEPEIPTVESLEAVGPWLYEPDRAVTQAGLLGAVTAADARQRGRHRPRLRRQRRERRRAVRPALRRARGDAVQRAVAAGLDQAARRDRPDHQEARRAARRRRLRRQLRIGRKAGDGAQATVILTRVAGQQVVLVVDPA